MKPRQFRIVMESGLYYVEEKKFLLWRKITGDGTGKGIEISFLHVDAARDWISKTLLEEQSKPKDKVIEYWTERQ